MPYTPVLPSYCTTQSHLVLLLPPWSFWQNFIILESHLTFPSHICQEGALMFWMRFQIGNFLGKLLNAFIIKLLPLVVRSMQLMTCILLHISSMQQGHSASVASFHLCSIFSVPQNLLKFLVTQRKNCWGGVVHHFIHSLPIHQVKCCYFHPTLLR